MKLKQVLAIGALSLALVGCNEKAEESTATAPAEVTTEKKDCSQCDTHKGAAAQQDAPVAQQQQTAPEVNEPQLMEDAAKKVAASTGTYKVEELFAKKAELNGKVVSVKGDVVKVSNGIMGRSWVHVQDGSGADGTNDIVFTSTTQTATVGDKIVATGTVVTDKDFGYGYFYSVIVEDSAFVMQ